MKKEILTPKRAQEIQNEIFRKMSAEQKLNLVSQFFEFGKKLSSLNDRRKIKKRTVPKLETGIVIARSVATKQSH